MDLKSLIPLGREHSPTRFVDPLIKLQREIDRLFDDFTQGWAGSDRTRELMPSVDIAESENEIEITVELPGMEEKDVEVSVADNILTIRGEKKAEKEEKQKNYRMYERSYGSFRRRLELPNGVNADKIKASLANGVLKVTVPKPPPAPAKKVDVKTIHVSAKEGRASSPETERIQRP
jgi:HSP20 family protein